MNLFKIRFSLHLALLISLWAGFSNTAQAGWLINGKFIDSEGKTYLHKVFIEGSFIKVERFNLIYICNLETGTIILVDPESLVYTQTFLDEYKLQSRKLMEERLAKLLDEVPASDRAKVERDYSAAIESIGKMPSIGQDTLISEKTKDTLVMSGYSTQKYLISLNGRKKEEVWIAPALPLTSEMKWERFFPFLLLIENQQKLVQIMSSTVYMQLLQAGYPMRKIMYEGGSRTEWQVNRVEKQHIPDYEFYTPVMCKKITVSEWLGRTKKADYFYDDYE